jgi:hypothetical protein
MPKSEQFCCKYYIKNIKTYLQIYQVFIQLQQFSNVYMLFEQNGPFGIAVCGQQTGCLQHKQQSVKLLINLFMVYLLIQSVDQNI